MLCKEIQPVHPGGDQSWVFTGRTDAEAPVLWPPDAKSHQMEKTLTLGKTEGRRRRGERMRWLDGTMGSMDMNLGGVRELVMDRRPGVLWFMGSQIAGHDWVTELTPVILGGSGIQTHLGEEILMDTSQDAIFLKLFRAAEGEERSPKGRVVVIYYLFFGKLAYNPLS